MDARKTFCRVEELDLGLIYSRLIPKTAGIKTPVLLPTSPATSVLSKKAWLNSTIILLYRDNKSVFEEQ